MRKKIKNRIREANRLNIRENYSIKEMVNFTKRQFNEILKKNLKIPVSSVNL